VQKQGLQRKKRIRNSHYKWKGENRLMEQWRFPKNDNGAINGFNDAGKVAFKGEHQISSLIKEICQNS